MSHWYVFVTFIYNKGLYCITYRRGTFSRCSFQRQWAMREPYTVERVSVITPAPYYYIIVAKVSFRGRK